MITRRKFTRISAAGIIGMAYPGIISSAYSSSNKIRIGQIGITHSHADAKIETLKKLNDVFHLVGVVAEDPIKQKKAAEKSAYHGVKWMTEDDLLSSKNLDAVIIETDLDQLIPTALRCVNVGLHVHIDKPLGKSFSELEDLLRIAQTKNLIVQPGYMFRYNPAFKFCLKYVKEGLLGDIFEIDGVISKVIKKERRQKLAHTYGGGMMLLGCHLIDILIAILGKPESLESFRQQTPLAKDGLYDNELLVLKHTNAISSVRSTLLEVSGQQRRQFVVCGKAGTIEIKPLEPPSVNLALKKTSDRYQAGYQTINLKKMSGRYDDQLLDFARMVRGEKEPDFSMKHDLLVHKILLEAAGFI
jgi:predicted dehydrogenase